MRYLLMFAAGLVVSQPLIAHPEHETPTASPAAADDLAAVDAAAVRSVLAAYISAVERLVATGTDRFFTPDSLIFESGGAEGNYTNYLSHHLTPELAEFKSFKFSDYKVDVRFEGPIALAAETYKYRIVTKKGEVADRLGVATSALRKENGRWKIVMMHNSSRKPSAP